MFDITTLLTQQQQEVLDWHTALPQLELPASTPDQFLQWVSHQNRYNFMLWHEEDEARDRHASDAIIAQVKRNIDQYNQARNDLIEQLDQLIAQHLEAEHIVPALDAKSNSETPGSIIDRLSISALKIYHMQEQLERDDVDESHLQQCQKKVTVLQQQRHDLGICLQELMNDLLSGRKRLKLYFQFKMYNDPSLNPVLYEKSAKG